MEEEKGITIIEFLKSCKEYWQDVKKSWLIIVVFVCFFIVIAYSVSFFSKQRYIASTTMMLESASGGGMSGAAALASQFGLLSGGGGGAIINEEKLLELIKSETIIKNALFQTASVEDTTDVLANHFMKLFWKEQQNDSKENEEEVEFKKENIDKEQTLAENKALKKIIAQIGTSIKAEKSRSAIVTLTVITPSESFSKNFNEALVNSLTSFYVDRITKKGTENIRLIEKRVDSIANALRDAEFTLARWKDGSNQMVKVQGMINEIKLRRNVEVCNSMYVEGVKQLEISKFSSLNQTPFLQVIDKPSFPLNTKGKIPVSKAIFGGLLIGLFVSGLYIWLKRKITVLKLQLKADSAPLIID